MGFIIKMFIGIFMSSCLALAQDKIKFYNEQPLWDSKLDLDKIERELKTEPIVELTPMKEHLKRQGRLYHYTTEVYFACLKNGLKAVFKPERKPFYCYGEVAGYRASKWFNLRLVPPTVLKEHQGMYGSLQFFVSSPFDLLRRADRERAFSLLSLKDKTDMRIFNYIFGQIDSQPHNQIIALTPDGYAYLALIDNAAFVYEKKRLLVEPKNLRYALTTVNRAKELSGIVLETIYEDTLRDKILDCSSLFKGILKRRDHVVKLAEQKR